MWNVLDLVIVVFSVIGLIAASYKVRQEEPLHTLGHGYSPKWGSTVAVVNINYLAVILFGYCFIIIAMTVLLLLFHPRIVCFTGLCSRPRASLASPQRTSPRCGARRLCGRALSDSSALIVMV